MNVLYAHTAQEGDDREWQRLDEHLNNTADCAEEFSSDFGAGTWGRALGILHDAGKATEAFQRRLHGSSETVDHSTFGAKEAISLYNVPETQNIGGTLMAYALAGHHGGMPNGILEGHESGKSLRYRLLQAPDSIDGFNQLVDEDKVTIPIASELESLPCVRGLATQRSCSLSGADRKTLHDYGVFSVTAFPRMIFSALVDADYLDTEEYAQPGLAALRARDYDDIGALLNMLEQHMSKLEKGSPDTPVNRARRSILADSKSAAEQAPGIFTMAAPTGSGKTLASLTFSLIHATRHDMSRVIIAIPFTSIVEQTAAVLKGIFGKKNVLEHHSSYDFEADSDSALEERLAVQNWDAPIIVTTNVQLLESLYSNKPGKCRKLHNIAKSVIILDEAQTIPDDLLMPSLAMLEDLTIDYGCSVVMSTATQPAVDELWPFGSRPSPIVRHTEEFDSAFGSRSEFITRGKMREDVLVNELIDAGRVLCVVGTKAKARRLYQEAKELIASDGEDASYDGVFHLSANMVPAHRSAVINQIRVRLSRGSRCIVISTQLIEAGVDVDFPVVYRELAGIDSLCQAAGRCNRNGRLRDPDGKPTAGKVHVFELEGADGLPDSQDLASNWLNKMKAIAGQIIRENHDTLDESMTREFFIRRYHTGDIKENLDGTHLYRELTSDNLLAGKFENLSYREYANMFKVISDEGASIFVPWEAEGRMLHAELERSDNPSSMVMRLQRFSVSVRPYMLARFEMAGALEAYGPVRALRMDDDCRSFYSGEVGLLMPGEEELSNMIV